MAATVKYTTRDAAKAVLSAKKAITTWEQEQINRAKYDTPCTEKEQDQKILLFLIWCAQRLDIYTAADDQEKVISKLNSYSGNFKNNISDALADAFLLTTDGLQITENLLV